MSNKEQVSIDECIECLREYISKQWNTESTQDMAKSALELLIIKIDGLKRLDESVNKNIAEYREDLKITGKNDCLISRKRLIELLESLYK